MVLEHTLNFGQPRFETCSLGQICSFLSNAKQNVRTTKSWRSCKAETYLEPCVILVGFQKAFDTLKYFGFRASVIKWFESYLSNRKFLVCIDVFSEAGTLKYGVPQGSILGPLLFLLYVNDLPQSLSDAGSYFYADYTCIFYQPEEF